MRQYHKDGTLPQNDEIFVFGSNEAGIHGAGAAKAAYDKFGAVWGVGFGLCGQSFAVPTKDRFIHSLPKDKIFTYVRMFVDFTAAFPDQKWFVTRVGCGLAGFLDREIAPMFKDAENCSFAEEWRQYLDA